VQVAVSALSQFRMRALSLRAAEALHAGMFKSLLYAPMAFFHINPSGRIINRLTKDTSDIDRNLAFYAALWFQSTLTLITTAAVVGTVTPFALPFIVPMLLVFGLLYLYFQDSVREVKRLDSLARSPIFTAVSNALTVRALPVCSMTLPFVHEAGLAYLVVLRHGVA
jgi:ATP-binding cassette, subfamily C (CFTR/MRP), member 1